MSGPISGLRRRDTAIKLPIVELGAGEEVKDSNGGRAFRTTLGLFRRVRVLGIVLNTYSSEKEGKKPYTSLTLDDGSGMIRIKGWGADAKRLAQFERGMVLDVIGRVRSSKDETYITSELEIQVTDPTWELIRRLEIVKQYRDRGIQPPELPLTRPPRVSMEPSVPAFEFDVEDSQIPIQNTEEPRESPLSGEPQKSKGEEDVGMDVEKVKDQLIVTIKKLDTGKGASYEDLRTQVGSKSEKIFEEALMDLLKDGVAYEPSPARYKILK